MCMLGGGRRSGGCPGEGCHTCGPSRETEVGFPLGPGLPPREPHTERASGSRSPANAGPSGSASRMPAPDGAPARRGVPGPDGEGGPAREGGVDPQPRVCFLCIW